MKKSIACIGLLFLYLGSLFAAGQPFQVSIVPETCSAGSATITWANDANRNFFIVLKNVTDKPQPVFERWNSWGYQTISFEMQLPDGHTTAITVKRQEFTRNFPSTYLVPPKEYEVFSVTFNDQWRGMPEVGKPSETKVVLKAIYHVAATPESKAGGVWTGSIESEPIEVALRHW